MRRMLLTLIVTIGLVLGFFGISQVYNIFNSNSLTFTLKPSQADLLQCQNLKRQQNLKTIRILVISGGGVAGLIPLAYLNYIENKTHQPINELFDLFVGTSTGSIIISFLNAENEQGKYMTAAELSRDYLSFSQEVLYSSMWRKIFTLNGFIGPKYNTNSLYQAFQRHGPAELKFYQLKNYVAVIDYLIEGLSLSIINNWDCHQPRIYATLPQILAGATAAPLMFAPVVFNLPNHKHETYIDGAVIANRPSLQAIRLVKQNFPKVERIIILSLGTGRDGVFEYHLSNKPLQHWGLLQWIEPLTRIFYFSQFFEAREGMLDLVSFVPKGKIQYYFLSSNQPTSPFNASLKNLESIQKQAKNSVRENQGQLDSIVKMLMVKDPR
jgi:predicted acylesterase/phospholipase RssA